MKKYIIIFLAAFITLLGGCNEQKEQQSENAPFYVLATTGMIGDALKNILPEGTKVEALMGPGVDPHLYKATRSDLTKMREADAIFYNGLHLEGKMGEVMEKLARQKPVFAVGEAIEESQLIFHGESKDSKDPHIWFDVSMWAGAVEFMAKKLEELMPENQEAISIRTTAYLKELENLDKEVGEQLASIPQERRVLITAHDAFSYFGRAYGVEVRGLQGISTVSEFGLKDRRELVDFIVDKGIKAVFVESSIPRKSLEAVVSDCQKRGHDIQVGGTLYSDAMGEAGTEAGNYLGMVKINVKTIVEALK